MVSKEMWDELPMEMRPKIRYWVPAALMDEDDLRMEIRTLKDRGFGGVEVVALSMLPPQITAGEHGWGTEQWEYMVGVIADETNKLGMTMDLANGPAWPIAAPGIRSADDPAALQELTFGVATVQPGSRYEGLLPERRKIHDEGMPKLIAALAYQQESGNILRQDSFLDLSGCMSNDELCFDFPEGNGQNWLLFAFYQQPACQKVNGNQTYVIDHLSKAGTRAMEAYWDGVFEKSSYPSMESLFCDSLEYQVTLDWTEGFLQEFEIRRGFSLLPYLPFIGLNNLYPACDVPGYKLDNEIISQQINNDYLEVLTQLHCENHLAGMERVARKYGKTVRYQVAYNKPYEADRCALEVALPENEALGRLSIDFQRIMASAAHIGRKERHSFECAAEFGHSYGQSYEDLLWWIKRSYMAGMNAQVLHGGSYSGKFPFAGWPGYEGFGKLVSNYWNRTLSVPHARGCLDAITRMNMIFRKTAQVDCAIYRSSYHNDGLGSEFCLYPDGGKLANRGYSYDFLSDQLLEIAGASVKNGEIDAGNTDYRCVIIPPQKYISKAVLGTIGKLLDAGVPIVWVGEKPVACRYYADVDRNDWQACVDAVWENRALKRAEDLQAVPDMLKELGILPRVSLNGDMDLMTATRGDDGNRYYALYAYNRVEFSPEDPNSEEIAVSAMFKKGTTRPSYHRPGEGSRRTVQVSLEGAGNVYLCNPWDGSKHLLSFCQNGNRLEGSVRIEEDEMLLLAVETKRSEEPYDTAESYEVKWESLELYSFEPDSKEETSFLRSHFEAENKQYPLTVLKPWRILDPSLEHFSGKGIYRGTFTIPENVSGRYVLELGDVCDTFTVRVNELDTPFPDQVMKRVDITHLIRGGENKVEVAVVSNLYNRFFEKDMQVYGMPVPYCPRDYGIWETDGKKIALKRYQ